MTSLRLCLAGVAALVLLAPATAQQPPPSPKPGPENELLKQFLGTWDCTVKMGPMQSKGKAVYKDGPGGLWILSNFTGEFAGQPFSGHGIDGYDPAKKKYVSVWIDSMDTAPMLSEGTYDKATKTLTMQGEAKGPDGKPATHIMKTQWKDKDTLLFSMSMKGPDGKEQPVMTIDYKRVK